MRSELSSQLAVFKVKTEEEIVDLVRESCPSPIIRIWEKEERISDDEILDRNPTIINIFAERKRSDLIMTCLGRNFEICPNVLFVKRYSSDLEKETIKALKAWGLDAFKVIDSYLSEKNVYLRSARFDFIPNFVAQTFIIPNIILENITFSESSKKGKIIEIEDFLDDLRAIEEFRQHMLPK